MPIGLTILHGGREVPVAANNVQLTPGEPYVARIDGLPPGLVMLTCNVSGPKGEVVIKQGGSTVEFPFTVVHEDTFIDLGWMTGNTPHSHQLFISR